MSEGSRGTQAPSRADEPGDFDDARDGEASPPSETGGAAGGDDFYATVNNAAASRSTRINHPNGDAPQAGSNGQENGSRSTSFRTDDEDDTEAAADAQTASGDQGNASTPGGHGVEEATAAGRTWRDRWTGLTGSMSGRRARTDEGSDAASARVGGARPAPSSTPTMTPVPARAATAPAGASAIVPASGAVAGARQAEQLSTKQKPKIGAARRTRKARLRLSRIDPWSVMKTSFLFSIAAGIVLVVAVYVIWTVIGSSGLFTSINDIVSSVVSTPGDTTPFRVEEYVNTQKVMGVTALVAVFDVLIFTAIATLLSFLYNLAATMLGGLEVTLAED